MYKKGQKISKEEYTRAAIWCNKNEHFIVRVGEEYIIDTYPAPTEEDILAAALAKAKEQRAEFVSKIIVTVDGMAFDGDETSQDRMARSIVALEDGETVQWVLADNTIAQVTKEQLRQALRMSGEAQTAIWADPYTKQDIEEDKEIVEEIKPVEPELDVTDPDNDANGHDDMDDLV